MNNNLNNKNIYNKYSFNDAMILDKIQEVLNGQNIDDLEFTDEEITNLMTKLSENISYNDIHDSA
ncbi:MAG: hypothetical protein ACRDD7_09085, partial [Peptostreptococcaceae bacterium]